jgi:hypothetical protein
MKDMEVTDPNLQSGMIAAAALVLFVIFSLIALASIFIGI